MFASISASACIEIRSITYIVAPCLVSEERRLEIVQSAHERTPIINFIPFVVNVKIRILYVFYKIIDNKFPLHIMGQSLSLEQISTNIQKIYPDSVHDDHLLLMRCVLALFECLQTIRAESDFTEISVATHIATRFTELGILCNLLSSDQLEQTASHQYCGVRANFDFNKCLCNNCA
ncbi:Hypothetical_protein [Hexamita inflata]|uniref:Hypothetical_protein n=1 Tax=Hexamita inflata TaxID=28002 RepID=A0AA86NXC0_9EUKA|nr:Hypothetical protein HINF_LOCUS15036 [Hexamita inflata]